jgi:alkylated DNA repair dioxygenase AlkB
MVDEQRIDLTSDGASYVRLIQLDTKIDFETLWECHPSEYGKVKVFGKEYDTPRWQQSYLRDYKFSGVSHTSLPLPECLKEVFEIIKGYDDRINGVLINWYNEEHYIGYHSDDESDLLDSSGIYCITYMENVNNSRRFLLQSKTTKEVKQIDLKHNSLIIMCGKTQITHKHSIPKLRKCDGHPGRRISITFRAFKD